MVASVLLAVTLLGFRPETPQASSSNRIERVDIRNNRRVRSDTIKYNLLTKAGDQLNMDVIRRDVKALYALNYFDDIRVETEDAGNAGIIVIFVVKERPLIRSIDFKGATSITRSEILDKLRERKISLSQESPLDPSHVK